jgi:hypothetical protein
LPPDQADLVFAAYSLLAAPREDTPAVLDVVSFPADGKNRNGVAVSSGAAGWHGCWFPLVRRHMMRNGAGKSTTMRLILGLDGPTAGTATVAGRPYRALRRPLFQVGAMLEAAGVHPGRSAHDHLLDPAARPRSRTA